MLVLRQKTNQIKRLDDVANKAAELLIRIKTAGEEAVDRLGVKFEDIKKIALGAFALISAAIIKGVAEYRETEEATNSLTRSMINNGIYSKQLRDQYVEQANALANVSKFEGDQIIAAQAALQQQIGSIKITKELTTAILDFATAQKMDVASAAEVVGKSIGTSTNALGRYGIEINTAASETQKMQQAIEGLNNKFGGQALAATDGLGALTMLHKTAMDLLESLGGQLAPVIVQVAQNLRGFSENSDAVSFSINALANTFKFIVSLGYGVIEVFNLIGTTIAGAISTPVEALNQLIQGNFSAAWTAIKTGANDTFETIKTDYQKYQNDINKIWSEGQTQQAANDEAEVAALKETLQRKKELQLQHAQETAIKKQEQDAINRAYDKELDAANHEEDMAQLIVNEDEKNIALASAQQAKLQAEIAHQNQLVTNATTQAGKLKALKAKEALENKLADTTEKKQELEREALQNKNKEMARQQSLGIISGLQGSSNQTLASIGKAAALTQIAIDTPVAVGRALSAFPPPFNFVAAAAVGAAMAAQAAKVAGIPLAEGGVVMPRPGGTQATIGEAGSAEAVIPLDKFPNLLSGGGGGVGITLNVYGGLLGDQSSAHEFAKAIDRELLKLRQNNESSAFDTGVV